MLYIYTYIVVGDGRSHLLVVSLFPCRESKLGDVELKEHDIITIDGSTGEVYLGSVERRSATEDEDFQTVLGWADKIRKLKVGPTFRYKIEFYQYVFVFFPAQKIESTKPSPVPT